MKLECVLVDRFLVSLQDSIAQTGSSDRSRFQVVAGCGRWSTKPASPSHLTLVLYGGLSLLLTFIVAHLVPGFRTLAGDPSGWRLTAAGIVVLFSLRMFSSPYIALTLDYYPFLFCVGACLSRDPSRLTGRQRPVLRSELTHARPLVYQ